MSKIKDFYFDKIAEEVPEFEGMEYKPRRVQLVLVRGLPGAGKSTYAQSTYPNHLHLEADRFFEQENGWGTEYVFDFRLLKAAHDWCYSNTLLHLRNGANVVVSNTFTQRWEMERYLTIPELFPEVDVHVVELRTQFQNVHGVPEAKMEVMKGRWESVDEDFKKVYNFTFEAIGE